ncbi:MAG TPA: hypothetical protein ENJ11_09545 [Gammaproteobacteria bacterium]|nr:hypothetical protein [Gammaproteobacteria bacterium]
MHTKTIALAVSLLLLTSCGGGGSSDNPPAPSSTNNPSPPPEPPPSTPTASTGVFIDSTVSGIAYQTPTYSGLTNNAGEYNYLPGETVTFSVGGIVFGSTAAGPVVTPLSLVSGSTDPTDPVVSNIVRLLLTLDDDGDASNGISISSATSTAATGVSVDFAAADLAADPGVSTLLASLPGSPMLVDAATAQSHFANTLATSWGTMKWGTGSWQAATP